MPAVSERLCGEYRDDLHKTPRGFGENTKISMRERILKCNHLSNIFSNWLSSGQFLSTVTRALWGQEVRKSCTTTKISYIAQGEITTKLPGAPIRCNGGSPNEAIKWGRESPGRSDLRQKEKWISDASPSRRQTNHSSQQHNVRPYLKV